MGSTLQVFWPNGRGGDTEVKEAPERGTIDELDGLDGLEGAGGYSVSIPSVQQRQLNPTT